MSQGDHHRLEVAGPKESVLIGVKGQGRSARLLTRSLRGIHTRAEYVFSYETFKHPANISSRLSLARGGFKLIVCELKAL